MLLPEIKPASLIVSFTPLPTTSDSSSPWRWPASDWWAGIALSGLLAAAGFWLAGLEKIQALGFSALTLAIVLGMVVGNTVFPVLAPHAVAGVDFSKNRLLRTGIILFGFRITLQEAASIGATGIILDAIVILCVFGLAMVFGRRVLRLDQQTCMLVGAGSAICGAAAVMAMEPVARAQAHKVSVAVATVVVFGTISMFLYPLLYPWLGMSEHAFGVYIGSTVHEVAQVVAAGNAVGPVAAKAAVVEKMLRVMMLAPFLLTVTWWMQRRMRGHEGGNPRGGSRVPVPWFAWGFVAAVAVNSLGVVPEWVAAALVDVSTLLLAMAMAALGLRTHAGAIRQAGAAPLVLAGVLFVFLVAGGLGLNLLAVRLG